MAGEQRISEERFARRHSQTSNSSPRIGSRSEGTGPRLCRPSLSPRLRGLREALADQARCRDRSQRYCVRAYEPCQGCGRTKRTVSSVGEATAPVTETGPTLIEITPEGRRVVDPASIINSPQAREHLRQIAEKPPVQPDSAPRVSDEDLKLLHDTFGCTYRERAEAAEASLRVAIDSNSKWAKRAEAGEAALANLIEVATRVANCAGNEWLEHQIVLGDAIDDLPSGEVEACVAIHEVYYDKQGLPNGYTADAVAPHGETWVAFLRDWENWMKAVDGGESKILDSRHDFNGRATPGETEGAK